MAMSTMLVAMMMVLNVGLVFAQSPYPEQRPLDLRITGAFVGPDQQKRDDIVTVDVTVQGKPMLLRIGKVEDLTTQEKKQAVKGEVLLHKVHLTGPEELMVGLQKPEALGKIITIEGWLDTQSRRLQVTAIKGL
ncbi:MAG: hypothetical protein FJ147_19335 [Deltaproteobacteria bacterium]|nr:hypothetical protein [Deltaproteobacteria bacterium]